MADVLIAGGGVAGAALALMLGRCGFEVELFERGHFPREKPCGEGLMPPGIEVLERWGLAEAVGGAPFDGVRYHFGDRVVTGSFPRFNGARASGRGQRRRVLDEVLFRAATATAGVRAHTGTPVDAPLVEKGRVTGLVVAGEERRAPLVVAADGLHSRLRHQLGLHVPARRKRVGLRMHFRLSRGQSQPPWVEIFVQTGRELYVTPLPGNELQVAALLPGESLAASGEGSVEASFRRWWGAEPVLARRLEGAEPAGELAGMSPLSSRARKGVAPGIVLLGDAAGFLDPITGGGMAQALLSAELLADCLVERRSAARTGRDADAWLWRFDRRRRVRMRHYRLMTHLLLWASDSSKGSGNFLPLMGRWPALLSHLVGVSAGMRPLWANSFGKSFAAPALAALVPEVGAPGATSSRRAAIL